MKAVIWAVSAIFLLRASFAYLSPQARLDRHDKSVIHSAQDPDLINEWASPEVSIENEGEEWPTSASSSHDPVYPSSSPLPPTEFTVGTTGSQWAMVYHPYNSDGTCRNQATVHADLTTIGAKGFSSIRLHNHDCNILPKLFSSPLISSQQIRIILGIHIDEEGVPEAASHLDEIISWAAQPPDAPSHASSLSSSSRQTADFWSSVELVVVGEESLFNNHVTATELAAFIVNTRAQLRNAGYTGPVTTTEPLHVLHESSSILCPHLDILASNIHPFFHNEVSAKTAGAFVEETLDMLERGVCPLEGQGATKQVVNLETGWPRRGRANGIAIPGREEQVVALEGILNRVGGKSVVLGYGDDEWMEEGEFGVEGSWGCEEIFPTQH